MTLGLMASPLIAQDGIDPMELLLSAHDPADIAAVMQDSGYRAELRFNQSGTPRIESSAAGTLFTVGFYGCDNGKDCTAIQFKAGFDVENGVDMAVANDWNAERRVVRAYLNEEMDPFIAMDVLIYDGMPVKLFLRNLYAWDRLMGDFMKEMAW